MILVGLTGGIGSGKSTVAAMLRERGAVVIDADAVAHEVMEPGAAAYQAVVDRFGTEVVAPGGGIDRACLASLVFADPAALADLNAIVHPAVREVMSARAEAEAATDHVVVLEIPLLVESGARRPGMAGVMVVDCPVDVAVARVMEQRGMDEEAIRARIAAQATPEERLAAADLVIDNSGPRDHLVAEVQRAWRWIEGLEPLDTLH
ncbi:MAG TPA: dephospho-CoA kinase [Acidimicrobiales bacterium]|nr:dephospho-CoA kinase [Acidimicrobiales bacterium]